MIIEVLIIEYHHPTIKILHKNIIININNNHFIVNRLTIIIIIILEYIKVIINQHHIILMIIILSFQILVMVIIIIIATTIMDNPLNIAIIATPMIQAIKTNTNSSSNNNHNSIRSRNIKLLIPYLCQSLSLSSHTHKMVWWGMFFMMKFNVTSITMMIVMSKNVYM